MINSAQQILAGLGIHADLYRYMILGGLIFTRMITMITFVPYLGAKPIPGRVRVAVSVAFLIFLYSPLESRYTGPLPEETAIILTFFLKEVLYGILLGYTAGLVFYGVQAAGGMIDNQRQLANAQIFNPAMGSQASLFGIFYYQLAIVTFLLLGGHQVFIRGVVHSFEVMPLIELPKMPTGITLADSQLITILIKMAGETLYICLQLASPVLIAIFIADIILGLTNRVAPMVNVFDLGFNIKGVLGVLLVFLSFQFVYEQMQVWFSNFMKYFLFFVDSLAKALF
ncbi:MAG: flagellar biosynthetic protein FliR [Deltaproteobacteria bacterium]|nr:flagellar biosynthetic protein FliR [Deltaproteobacteria bacterium]